MKQNAQTHRHLFAKNIIILKTVIITVFTTTVINSKRKAYQFCH